MLKINNEIVEAINVKTADDYDDIKTFKINQSTDIQKQLAEIYDFIQNCKKSDQQMIGEKLRYIITLETSTSDYGDYNIRKHDNGVYSIIKG